MTKALEYTAVLGLVLCGFVSTADAQDDCSTFDRERGECSPGTDAPTQDTLLTAIRSAAPTRLAGLLEYGEMVECYACVPALAERVLTDDNERVREFASWWLRRRTFVRGDVFGFFQRTLEGENAEYGEPEHRARAAMALGEFMDPTALNPLATAAMGDTESVVRAAAVSALGRLNHPEGNVVLAAALSDGDAQVRHEALESILVVNFYRDYDALIGTLADDDAQVRQKGAMLVGQFQVDAAVDALAGLLRGDESSAVRRSAAWALGRIGTNAARDALREVEGSDESSTVNDAIEVALRMF